MGSGKDKYPKSFDVDMTPFHDLMERMDQFFNKSFKQMNSFFDLKPFWADMYETDTTIVIEADLADYNRDQIELEVIRNQIRIAVKDSAQVEGKDTESSHYSKQQSMQIRERWIALPFPVSENNVTAAYQDNGILKITIPKPDEGRKFIEINQ